MFIFSGISGKISDIGFKYNIASIPELFAIAFIMGALITVVVKKEYSDNVLKAIYDRAGLGTDGAGIAFALPVDETLGIIK